MAKRKPITLSEPIPAGEYFVCQRVNGDIDSFLLAETDLVNVKPGKYRGNAERVLTANHPSKDPEFRGTWDFYDGGILRPATRDELEGLRDELYHRLGLVVTKLRKMREESR